jgi:DNA repair exonuclease SbcCD nuclease subunit
MRIIVIGDPHIKLSNFQEFDNFVEKLIKLIERKKPDIIVVLGDVLDNHERIHALELNKAHEFIKKLMEFTKTYVLVGNHDLVSNQEFLTTNHWMNSMKEWGENLVIVDKVVYARESERDLMFCPYVPPGTFEKALNTCEYEWTDMDLIFAHQEFKGCKMGAIISEEGDEWDEKSPFVISGHIHSNQKIGENVYYPGSAMQNAFGESEKNIIACVELGEDGYELDEVDLELPRKKIVYMDIENIEEYEKGESSDKVKISLSGNYEEFKSLKKTSKYKELVKSGVKIVFKNKKIDVKRQVEKIENEEGNFSKILHGLVDKVDDKYVKELYFELINV